MTQASSNASICSRECCLITDTVHNQQVRGTEAADGTCVRLTALFIGHHMLYANRFDRAHDDLQVEHHLSAEVLQAPRRHGWGHLSTLWHLP